MIFGSHVSIAGGVDGAPARAAAIGADTFQVFVKPNRQWRFPDLPEERCRGFLEGCRGLAAPPVAHSSYLLNLAAPDAALRQRSAEVLAQELAACGRLGIPDLVLHPGSHGGDGEEAGLARIAKGLHLAAEASPGGARVALESTAGTGHHLGWRLGHLAHLLEAGPGDRLSVCLDTCHLFAAGHDLSTRAGVGEVSSEVEEAFGWGRVSCVHLNDSRHPCGSRKDRHAHVGRGHIGEEGFAAFLAIPRVGEVPGILETPKKGGWDDGEPDLPLGGDEEGNRNDRLNLAVLRSLAP